VAYDLIDPADFAALSPGVSWWYNWAQAPNSSAPANATTTYTMDFYPMLWNGNFTVSTVVAYLKANPSIKYILVMNEPNLTDQANLTPQQAALIWPQYEAVAAQTGVQIVGPAITWGTMAGYANPVTWLDAFYTAYEAANANRKPQIDYLAFHWYDYGLADQLNALDKYGKSIWVTEFANWHSQSDGAQIDTLALQEAQMTDMVATCENRSDVFRYAWFTGRMSPDPHFTSLLGAAPAAAKAADSSSVTSGSRPPWMTSTGQPMRCSGVKSNSAPWADGSSASGTGRPSMSAQSWRGRVNGLAVCDGLAGPLVTQQALTPGTLLATWAASSPPMLCPQTPTVPLLKGASRSASPSRPAVA